MKRKPLTVIGATMPGHHLKIESLRTTCDDRLFRRYESDFRELAMSRRELEISLVERQKHQAAFHLAAEIGQFADKEGIVHKLVGAGPCSVLFFLMQLTDIDPLRHHLPAERLLANREINFVFIVDPEHADKVQEFADKRSGFEKLQVHSATDLEMIPHQVAKLIQRNHDPKFDVRCVPWVDNQTGEHLGLGDTTGISQLESEDLRYAVGELKPSSLEALSALVAAFQISADGNGVLEKFLERARCGHSTAKQVTSF